MDTARPSLILMRLICAVVAFSYGALRFIYDDRAPIFAAGPGDPILSELPYSTNPAWATAVVVLLTLTSGYVIFQTSWIGLRDYTKYQTIGISPTPWSVIFGMTFITLGAFYYAIVGLLILSDPFNAFWTTFMAFIMGTLTAYEIKRHDG